MTFSACNIKNIDFEWKFSDKLVACLPLFEVNILHYSDERRGVPNKRQIECFVYCLPTTVPILCDANSLVTGKFPYSNAREQ